MPSLFDMDRMMPEPTLDSSENKRQILDSVLNKHDTNSRHTVRPVMYDVDNKLVT